MGGPNTWVRDIPQGDTDLKKCYHKLKCDNKMVDNAQNVTLVCINILLSLAIFFNRLGINVRQIVALLPVIKVICFSIIIFLWLTSVMCVNDIWNKYD